MIELLYYIYSNTPEEEHHVPLDSIYNVLDGKFHAGEFDEVNKFFEKLDPSKMALTYALGFVTVGAWARDKMPAWAGFTHRCFAHCTVIEGMVMAQELFGYFIKKIEKENL